MITKDSENDIISEAYQSGYILSIFSILHEIPLLIIYIIILIYETKNYVEIFDSFIVQLIWLICCFVWIYILKSRLKMFLMHHMNRYSYKIESINEESDEQSDDD